MKLVTFDHIAGVPVHYAREPVAKYGTRGKGPRKVRLEESFHRQLEGCLHDLWETCPLGVPEVLVSGGCYVMKAGAHGEGRAIDIDAIWWPDMVLVTKNALKTPQLYLGVESVLRTHFGNVLDFWYNDAHQDHFHIDNHKDPSYRFGSRSQSVYLQASLKYVHGHDDLGIDGWVGKETNKALHELLPYYSMNAPVAELWESFIGLTAKKAFSQI